MDKKYLRDFNFSKENRKFLVTISVILIAYIFYNAFVYWNAAKDSNEKIQEYTMVLNRVYQVQNSLESINTDFLNELLTETPKKSFKTSTDNIEALASGVEGIRILSEASENVDATEFVDTVSSATQALNGFLRTVEADNDVTAEEKVEYYKKFSKGYNNLQREFKEYEIYLNDFIIVASREAYNTSVVNTILFISFAVLGLIVFAVLNSILARKTNACFKVIENEISLINRGIIELDDERDEAANESHIYNSLIDLKTTIHKFLKASINTEYAKEVYYDFQGDFQDNIKKQNRYVKIRNYDFELIESTIELFAQSNFSIDISALEEMQEKDKLNSISSNLLSCRKNIEIIISGFEDNLESILEGRLVDIDVSAAPKTWQTLYTNINRISKDTEATLTEFTTVLKALNKGDLSYRSVSVVGGNFKSTQNEINNLVDNLHSQVKYAKSVLADIRKFNLGTAHEKEFAGEFGIISDCISEANKVILSLVYAIDSTVNTIVSESNQLGEEIEVVQENNRKQVEIFKDLVQVSGKLIEGTKESLEESKDTNKFMNEIKGNVVVCDGKMDNMLVAMESINDASIEINKISELINNIGFQTKLLALNASIEAALAGQHGKGFAVVADEVSNLARRNQTAATDTGELVTETISRVEEGSIIAQDTAESLKNIVSLVNEIFIKIKKIDDFNLEQIKLVSETKEGFEKVDIINKENVGESGNIASINNIILTETKQLTEVLKLFNIEKVEDKSTLYNFKALDNTTENGSKVNFDESNDDEAEYTNTDTNTDKNDSVKTPVEKSTTEKPIVVKSTVAKPAIVKKAEPEKNIEKSAVLPKKDVKPSVKPATSSKPKDVPKKVEKDLDILDTPAKESKSEKAENKEAVRPKPTPSVKRVDTVQDESGDSVLDTKKTNVDSAVLAKAKAEIARKDFAKY